MMNPGDEKPQQPPQSRAAKQQQQTQGGEGQQYGEGNYKATRQYNEGLKDHVRNHDIERDARNAAPRNASEEQEMEEAERIGRSKSRADGPEDPSEGAVEKKRGE